MNVSDLMLDAFDRVQGGVHRVVEGLGVDALMYRPAPDANSIAWLVWHLTRVQDDHVAALAEREQAWIESGFADRFGLPLPVISIGYGHTSADVDAVKLDADQLAGYHDAVQERSREFLAGVTSQSADRIVDRSWDPPVTEGARLVSVVSDSLQHIGQAGYVRGLLP